MRSVILLFGLLVALVAGCSRPAAADAVLARPAPVTTVTGPRWVVIKASGLDCATCAADLKVDLARQSGVSQIETFAPAPYCRFYVEDGRLDVRAMIDKLKGQHVALDDYKFVRGG